MCPYKHLYYIHGNLARGVKRKQETGKREQNGSFLFPLPPFLLYAIMESMKIVKRRLMWIIELFVWLLILLLISSGIMYAKYNYKKNFDTYQIFLHDVDGLIVGSPVKFLGIQVGYVNQLNITGEDIYVNFIITDTDVQIPRGSKATVEFSGLGGSRSLELYPPTAADKESSMLIVPQPPKRIGDSLGLLNDMFDKAVEITYDVSHFMEEMGFIISEEERVKRKEKKINQKWKKKNGKNKDNASSEKAISSGDLLDKCNAWFDKAQNGCDKLNENLKKKKAGKNGKTHG